MSARYTTQFDSTFACHLFQEVNKECKTIGCLSALEMKICNWPITKPHEDSVLFPCTTMHASSDHIQPELLKHAESITPRLANLFNTVWQKQEVPTDWRDGIIIPLPKKVICLTVTTGEASPCCQSQAKCLQV